MRIQHFLRFLRFRWAQLQSNCMRGALLLILRGAGVSGCCNQETRGAGGSRIAVQNLKMSSTAVQLQERGFTSVKILKHNCSHSPLQPFPQSWSAEADTKLQYYEISVLWRNFHAGWRLMIRNIKMWTSVKRLRRTQCRRHCPALIKSPVDSKNARVHEIAFSTDNFLVKHCNFG